MKRYSIFVKENFADREVELLQVDNNPDEIVKGLRQKTVILFDGKKNKRTSISKFESIRVVENAEASR